MHSIIKLMQMDVIINGVSTNYIVDMFGNIYRRYSDGVRVQHQTIGTHGYKCVTLYYNGESHQHLVHRLVAVAFCSGRSDDRDVVNHKDGIKTNNVCTNLEWVTTSENMIHAVQHNLHPGNTTNGVYTDDQIHEICRLMEEGQHDLKEIADSVGVNYTLIRDIKFRNKHANISSMYNINMTPVGFKDMRDKIFELMSEGLSNSEIADVLEFNQSNKRHIEYCRSLFNMKNNTKISGRYKRVDKRQNNVQRLIGP